MRAFLTPAFGVHIRAVRYQLQLWTDRSNLGRQGGVWFFEQQPDLGPHSLPARELRRSELFVESELGHDLLLGRLVAVEVQSVEDLQRFTRVAVARVRHPTARLHLQHNKYRNVISLLLRRISPADGWSIDSFIRRYQLFTRNDELSVLCTS